MPPLASHRRPRTFSASRTRHRFLPGLNLMEKRVVPSTLTVVSEADSGVGSLRQALADAGQGDSIVFAHNVRRITLTSGELDVTGTVNILGPGAGRLTISGGGASRVLHVERGASAVVTGLTIAQGHADVSGGGGIRNEAGATLVLVGDVVRENTAVGLAGMDVFGGGLFNLGVARIHASQFLGNSVVGGGSFTAIGGSAGGAIDNYAGGVLTVSGSLFMNNAAVSADGAGYYALGGAIDSNAGPNGFDPAQAVPSHAVLTNCMFVGNTARGGAQATANGGAVIGEGVGTHVSLTGCLVSGNRSIGGNGGDGKSGLSEGIGGGLMNLGIMDVVRCKVVNNQAIGGNSATPTSDNPSTGGAFGGGIENNFRATMTILDSTVAGNIAQGGASAAGPGGNAVGGGISNSPNATLTMINTSVLHNRAAAGRGASGASDVPAGLAFGGGVDTSFLSTTTILGCKIAGNQAVGGHGGAGNAGGDGLGGGLSVGFNALVGVLRPDFPEDSHLTVVDTVVAKNTAVGGKGGAGAAGGDGKGGGLFVFSRPATVPEATATLTRSTFRLNSALGGTRGPGPGGAKGRGLGGGIYNDRGLLTRNAATVVADNHASTAFRNIFSV